MKIEDTQVLPPEAVATANLQAAINLRKKFCDSEGFPYEEPNLNRVQAGSYIYERDYYLAYCRYSPTIDMETKKMLQLLQWMINNVNTWREEINDRSSRDKAFENRCVEEINQEWDLLMRAVKVMDLDRFWR